MFPNPIVVIVLKEKKTPWMKDLNGFNREKGGEVHLKREKSQAKSSQRIFFNYSFCKLLVFVLHLLLCGFFQTLSSLTKWVLSRTSWTEYFRSNNNQWWGRSMKRLAIAIDLLRPKISLSDLWSLISSPLLHPHLPLLSFVSVVTFLDLWMAFFSREIGTG